MPDALTFDSSGTPCHAWHFQGQGDEFRSDRGRPCMVMAHGFSATKDSGLAEYAERLAEGGVDVLAIDYCGFGASTATAHAAAVNPRTQQADYHAAVACARSLPAVDPNRIIVWGISLSAGHVLAVAAADPSIAGVIAVTPAVDGPAAIRVAVKRAPVAAARIAAAGVADLIATLRRKPPVTVAVVGEPGTPAVMAAPGAAAGYSAMAGPTAINAVPARSVLRVAAYRPGRKAAAVTRPVLVQIADNDLSAPPSAARKAAFKCRADVRHYPCDHFDVYPGADWFESVVDHQLHFLRRNFAPESPFAPLTPLVVTA